MSPDPKDGRTRLSRGKRALFGLVVVGLFFTLLEVVLILAGVEPDPEQADPLVGFAKSVPHFVVESGDDGVERVRTAPNKRKFLNDQSFPRSKPAGTTRVFCVGGSTTYGRPFFDDLSFAGYLREMLPLVDTSTHWEVLNAGAISYASYRVTGVMEDLAPFDPDVFIVYTGQNEFLESRTYESLLATPGIVREALSWAKGTRTGTLISRVIKAKAEAPANVLPTDPKITAVDAVGPDAYRRDDEFKRHVLDHFRRNLNRMVDIAEGAGAKIVFVVPASNILDFSPFRSESAEGLTKAQRAEFDRLLRQGTALRQAGRNGKAAEVLRRAVAIDDRHAEAQFQFGKALLATGDTEDGVEALRRARDEDICPMRAIEAIQATVRSAARERGAGLVDTFPGLAMKVDEFYDHVHLTPRANEILARLLVAGLTEASADDPRLDPVNERLMARRDGVRHAGELRALTRMLTWLKEPELALRAARDSATLDPANPDSEVLLGTLLVKSDPASAARHYAAALALDPESPSAHFQLALVREGAGDLGAAVGHLEAAVKASPEFRAGWERLALIQVRRGRINDSVWAFRRVVELDPKRSDAHSNLGLAYAKQGEPARAFAAYKEAIRLDSKNASAHYNKGLLHEGRGEREAAIAEYRTVLSIRPTHAEARRHLAELGATLPK